MKNQCFFEKSGGRGALQILREDHVFSSGKKVRSKGSATDQDIQNMAAMVLKQLPVEKHTHESIKMFLNVKNETACKVHAEVLGKEVVK